MKRFKSKSINVLVGVTLAAAAFAAITTGIRLVDGGSTGVGYVTYSRGNGTSRYAYLAKNTSGYFDVWVAGGGLSTPVKCNTGVQSCTRPSISRDGNLVAFWGRKSATDQTLRAYFYYVGWWNVPAQNFPRTTTQTLSDQVHANVDSTDVWPPQASDVRSDSNFTVVFVDRRSPVTPLTATCTANPSSYNGWTKGQLYRWDGDTTGWTWGSAQVVSTADPAANHGCQYLVTEGVGEDGLNQIPATVGTYAISSDGSRVAWSATSVNQKLGVTQNHEQLIRTNIWNPPQRELVSKNNSGTEGDGRSLQPSMTGDANKIAFASEASNLTSFSDANGYLDIFVRDVTSSQTTAAYSLALNNTGSLYDATCWFPVISGNGSFVGFDSYSWGLLGSTGHSMPGGYSIGATSMSMMSTLATSSVQLASFAAPSGSFRGRPGFGTSVNFGATKVGFHSGAGDIALPVQTNAQPDIYEQNGP